MRIAIEILENYQKTSIQQENNINAEIEKLEEQLSQPYIKDKENPYFLHAILIHDGLAENGHYYSYVFDRVNKCWFCFNDHKVTQVHEELVMKEALGNP